MPASRDVPPELRVGDEVVTWSDTNGVYDRDDSLKENTNPKCLLKNHHHHHSQRFSGNLNQTRAPPIIGLPGNLGGAARRHPHHHHAPAIFPKKARTGGGGRQAKSAVPEPGSPRVSCFGKVGSQRERALRQLPLRARPSPGPPRCCGGLGFLMRRSRSRHSVVECVDQSPPPPPSSSAAARRREVKEVETEAEAPAPGLGGMRRFSSGRRAAEMEDAGHVARSGPS